ncbi:MAG: T9SS type A sorting domain-containing protein [Bacteroidota bacterium]
MIKHFLCAVSLFSLVSLSAQQKYGLITVTGNSAFGTQKASYLQNTAANITSINNSKASEIAGWNNVYSFDNNLFVTNIDGDNRITKYRANANGTVTVDKVIIVAAASTGLSYLTFINNNLAVAVGYNFVLYFFNPTTMALTGDRIDLTSLVDNTYNSSDPTEIIYRDGKLFLGIMYRSYFGPFSTTIKEECTLAVLDLATKKLDKVIKNTKTMPTGIHANYSGTMLKDDNGDIYCLGTKFYDSGESATNPTAVLRIKKGETDFDSTYFFNTEVAAGNRGVISMEHAGGSKAFVCVYYPERKNPIDPYSAYNDPVFKYWAVDLVNKTAQEMNMPFHKGYTNNWMHLESDGKVYAPVTTASESAVYELNHSTRTSTKKFTTTGEAQGFYPLISYIESGVSEFEVRALSIYPNPVSQQLHVDLPEGIAADLTISNALGQVVFFQAGYTGTPVELSSVQSGVYHAKIQGTSALYLSKFIKQ